MPTFTDLDNRQWTVKITVADVNRVRDTLTINLLDVLEDDARILGEIMGNLSLLVDVVWCVCQKQAREQNVTVDQFAEGMGGDVLLRAADSLMEALIDFFPQARMRKAMRKLIQKGQAVSDLVAERLEREIDELDPTTAAEAVFSSATSSAASPGSIRNDTPSAS